MRSRRTCGAVLRLEGAVKIPEAGATGDVVVASPLVGGRGTAEEAAQRAHGITRRDGSKAGARPVSERTPRCFWNIGDPDRQGCVSTRDLDPVVGDRAWQLRGATET